jgi:two-component system, LuxR family, sensor kinase FixL
LVERQLGLDALLESMAAGFAMCEAIWDSEGRLSDYTILEMNPVFQRMLRIGPEAVGTKLSDGSLGDHSRWLQLCEGVLKTGQPASTEHHTPSLGLWHEIRVIRVTKQKIAQLVFDVTHAHTAKEKLRESESHLQSILDTVPDAMVVVDEDAIIQSFSGAAETLFGWTSAEAIGQDIRILMPLADPQAQDSYLEQYVSPGERRMTGHSRIVTARRKDGSQFPVELFVGEVRSGSRRLFTGFVRDLTERQAAQARLQVLQSELAHVSRLSAMGEMAASLAHELNQPLAAIANYLKGGRRLLEAENRDSRARPPIEKAAIQALRAGEIIRRLRNFIASGESDRSQTSLSGLLEEAIALGLVGARERGIATHIELSPAVDAVVVDRVQVQQVVLNLLRNAMDAMKDSARRELRLTTSAADDDMAMVSVADTGPGISPQIADRLFQPFVSTKGRQGMGVGLSISRGIIEAHGGRLWAEPNPSGGTVFRFTLPRVTRRVD